ncbi:MAG: restriction endonuclease subunit S, partial [Hydrogenovibrio crunogenus]|nr:restriction endonuclease subunit S [Hydrogenovibrio crunogenus]
SKAINFKKGKALKNTSNGIYQILRSNGVIGTTELNNNENALIIGRVGAYCGSIELSQEKFWASDNTIVAEPKPDNVLHYWYYRLKSFPLRKFAGGAAQPLLTQNTLKPLKIAAHTDYLEQDKIANILKVYDDLIENNNRRIALLEESARLLYQEWFVHLRFPGHEHCKIIDGVPEGWERTRLEDLIEEIKEAVNPESIDSETPYIGLEHMPRRSITLSEWETVEKVTSKKYRYYSGDIIFGKIRPYFHKVGFAITDGVTSSDAVVVRSKDISNYQYLLMYLSSDFFISLASKTVKEGSKMPRADWKYLMTTDVQVPSDFLLKSFSDSVDKILKQLKTLSVQNKQLKKARDILLPRLMNGEIVV